MHEFLNCIPYLADKDYSSLRVTVDTREDFELAKEIFIRLKQLHFIRCADVVDLLKDNPDLVLINKDVTQKDLVASR
jgi:spore coat polysaccharide biosynthesis protein SpsF (cytidylyltransferase family)